MTEYRMREYKASRFWGGWFAWTKLLMPDTITVKDGKIFVNKKQFFGLKGSEEEVSLEKVASVRLEKGFFTGYIKIETSGGAVDDLKVKNFSKRKAKEAIIELRGIID